MNKNNILFFFKSSLVHLSGAHTQRTFHTIIDLAAQTQGIQKQETSALIVAWDMRVFNVFIKILKQKL